MISIRQRNAILKAVKKNGNLYLIDLSIDWFSACDLKQMIELLFLAWQYFYRNGLKGYIKNFSGILRKLLIAYSGMRAMYRPFFLLLCSLKDLARFKALSLEMISYINWYKATARASKCCTNVNVQIKDISQGDIALNLAGFCNKPLLQLIDTDKAPSFDIMQTVGKHKLLTAIGEFKLCNEMQR